MIRSLPVIPNDPRKARILFLHFWAKGPTEALARGIQGALKTTAWGSEQTLSSSGTLLPMHSRRTPRRENYVAKFSSTSLGRGLAALPCRRLKVVRGSQLLWADLTTSFDAGARPPCDRFGRLVGKGRDAARVDLTEPPRVPAVWAL